MTVAPEDILLDEQEQWIEDHLEEFAPAPEWVGKSLHQAACNTMEESRNAKRQISINIDSTVISYFKELAAETGVGYQSLINMFLVQCVKEKKRPLFV